MPKIKIFNILNDAEHMPKINIVDTIEVKETLYSPQNAVKILQSYYNVSNLYNEEAFLLMINSRLQIIGISVISVGEQCSCDYYPKMIFLYMLLSGARCFVTGHNHPNGIAHSSEDDDIMQARVQELADLFNFEYIDNLIIV